MRKKNPAFLLLPLFFWGAPSLFAQTLDQHLWTTNGYVRAIVRSGNTIYLGGSFTQVGPSTGGGAVIDTLTGEPNLAFPNINGGVQTVVPDGSGGWYIGGGFSHVDGIERNNLARINADGTLNASWNPNADGGVSRLALSGSTVYVTGWFTNIGGQPRNNIAALDTVTGSAKSWNPNATGGSGLGVRALAVSGQTVYVGGDFTAIGGQTRHNIAAIDATTGWATDWNPYTDAIILALAVSDTTVYAGGWLMTTIGGQPRNGLAALDARTGLARDWNPGTSGGDYVFINALALSDSRVYAAGEFSSIGGETRNGIAALDKISGAATPWNPNPDVAAVYAVALSGASVYVGGIFNSIDGQPRRNLACIDSSTGTVSNWNPRPSGGDYINVTSAVYALAISGSTVYVGGNFTMVGGETRNRIAAFDAATGKLTNWDPNATGGLGVFALALSGSKVFVSGYFTAIGGQPRNNIAAIDASTGNVTAWNPDANGYVDPLIVSDSTVYVGGGFTTIGGQARNYIAALDTSFGNATSWNPNANSDVAALVTSGSTVYVGGGFTTIGGQTRNHIAAIDASTGNATSWNPDANDNVSALLISGSTVYVGGEFTTMGGQTRNHLAALGVNTGLATSWDPNADGSVRALALSGSTIYAGGGFSTIGLQSRTGIAGLDANTGLATVWTSNARNGESAGSVEAIHISNGVLYAGGTFTMVGNWARSYFAGLPTGVTSVPLREEAPRQVALSQNYPNPFNPSTEIRFTISRSQLTSLRIYDLLGREVVTLVNDVLKPGTYSVTWDASEFPSGVYFYRLTAGQFTETKKLTLVR